MATYWLCSTIYRFGAAAASKEVAEVAFFNKSSKRAPIVVAIYTAEGSAPFPLSLPPSSGAGAGILQGRADVPGHAGQIPAREGGGEGGPTLRPSIWSAVLPGERRVSGGEIRACIHCVPSNPEAEACIKTIHSSGLHTQDLCGRSGRKRTITESSAANIYIINAGMLRPSATVPMRLSPRDATLGWTSPNGVCSRSDQQDLAR